MNLRQLQLEERELICPQLPIPSKIKGTYTSHFT
ncbi:hypothetical protein SAMN05216191_107127, partial [Paenibacillus jilunlii]